MAKYVNFSLGTLGHAGTALDPYNMDDFRSSVNSSGDTLYYLKGSFDFAPTSTPDWLHPTAAMSFLPWPGESGKWRVRIQTGSSSDNYLRGTWKGGHIFYYNPSAVATILTINGDLHLYSMQVELTGNLYISSGTTQLDIIGSSIMADRVVDMGVFYEYPLNCVTTIQDSTLDIVTWYYQGGA